MPLRNLSDEQAEAASYVGNLLLTACPGSGKTRTVAARIAYEVSMRDPCDKRWVVAITHTNIAAETILERLDKAGIEAERVWVGTIHSFCLEWILKPYAGLDPRIACGYRIINEFEQRLLERQLKVDFGLGPWDKLPLALNEDFEVEGNEQSPYVQAARTYHAILQLKRLIDFDLILSLAKRMARTFDVIGQRLGALFTAILVDEYQDLSQSQYDILACVTRHQKSRVMMVGDIDQAIRKLPRTTDTR